MKAQKTQHAIRRKKQQHAIRIKKKRDMGLDSVSVHFT